MGSISSTSDKDSSQILEPTTIPLPVGMVIKDDVLNNWGNASSDLIWDVTFMSKGIFSVAIGISNDENHKESKIEVEINSKVLELRISPSDYYESCTTLPLGSLSVNSPGFSSVRVRAKGYSKTDVGRLHFVKLSGPAVNKIRSHNVVSWEFLRSSNVSLLWKTNTSRMNMFYNEITIHDNSADAFFVVLGFYRGYVALQPGKILYAIKNPGLSPDLPESKIPKRYHVSVLKHLYGTRIEHQHGRIKAECTYYYQWKPGETYQFLLTAAASNLENCVLYSAYFYRKDTKNWILLATYKVVDMQKLFSEMYSSIENCQSFHGFNEYQASFGPAYKNVNSKGWVQLTHPEFHQLGVDEGPNDVNVEVTDDNRFLLSTGGSARKSVVVGAKIKCKKHKNLPEPLADLGAEILTPKEANTSF